MRYVNSDGKKGDRACVPAVGEAEHGPWVT